MNSEQNEYINLAVLLVDFWRGIQKYWIGILIITLLSVGGYLGYEQMGYVPMYRAQATFTVKTVGGGYENETSTGYTFYYDKNTANQIGTTFPYILSSDAFMSRLKAYLGTEMINGTIGANVIENSNLVNVSVASSSAEDAVSILEGVLEVYPEIARYVIGNTKLDVIKEPEADAFPYNKKSTISMIAKGAEFGLVLSFALLALYALTKKTIRRENDLKQILNVSCLAQIPEVKSRNALKPEQKEPENNYLENIYALQNRVDYLLQKNKMKVLVVTSTGPSEGKSTISANLAAAMARRGRQVLLIDGDLRKPDLKKYYENKTQTASIQNLLKGEADLEDTVISLDENLLFMGNDKPLENPTKMLQSTEMKELIEALKENTDLVIIDTPPCGMLADASYYTEYADAVLYVVRQDWADGRKILNAVEELPDHGEKIIGCVLNRVRTGFVNYGAYGYGHYRRYNQYRSRYYGSHYRFKEEPDDRT